MMTVWVARVAGLVFAASACVGIAHADPGTVDEAVSEEGQRTCHTLSQELTGQISQDEQVFMAEISSLQGFYGMSERDASMALGHMIRDDCPQFRPNINAINASLGDQ